MNEFLVYGLIAVIPLHLILLGLILFIRSIKRQEAKKTELINTLLHELQLQKEKLTQSDKMVVMGSLTAGVAHEINCPNGLLLLSIPTLRHAYKDAMSILDEYYNLHGDFSMGGLPYSRMRDQMYCIFDEMVLSASSIKQIVHDLKDFAKSSGPDNNELIDFNMTVQQAIRLSDFLIKKATNSFVVDYGEELPKIWGNSQQIGQVIINLILNACQALPDTNSSIRLSTTYNQSSGYVVLRVKDQGVGISPEHLSKLFDPLFTTKQDAGGTGLGLWISSSIVECHKGNINIDSTLGEGTTATLMLPCANMEDLT
ncbi:MAG: hypothetical protein HGB32_07500 [Geobacteraceae bacterium]|nr:hypothetical protein [Geobacteraceae bacterium]